ncbi:MAG: hypothetical protein NTV04_17115, partial [Deltaproteobacteria bacterium]|nr:hypothetical protein [Deltaproteobacteria bacterium]
MPRTFMDASLLSFCAPGIWSFLQNHQPGNKKTRRKFQAGFFSPILPSSAGVSEKSQIVTSSE